MKYKKLIESAIRSQQSNNLTVFALLTGLAAGAAIAILFAPRSGRASRIILSKKLNLTATPPHNHKLEDHIFDDLRENTRQHADHLQGAQNKRKDPTQIKVRSAGTTAWKKHTD